MESDATLQGGVQWHQEGALTVLRSAVVNNTRLAAAAMALQLHTSLKMDGDVVLMFDDRFDARAPFVSTRARAAANVHSLWTGAGFTVRGRGLGGEG